MIFYRLNISLFKEEIQLKYVSIIPNLLPSLGIIFYKYNLIYIRFFLALERYKSWFIVQKSSLGDLGAIIGRFSQVQFQFKIKILLKNPYHTIFSAIFKKTSPNLCFYIFHSSQFCNRQ